MNNTIENISLTDEKPKPSNDRSRCLPASTRPSFPLKFRLLYFLLNTIFRFTVTSRNGRVYLNRKAFTSPAVPPDPVPDADGVSTTDHIVDPTTGLLFRHFSPSSASASPLPVVVYFHGGGFITSSAVDHFFDMFCRRIASQIPAHVISVEYRLAPEHRCPAQYDDGSSVLRYLDDANLFRNLTSVFIAGDSAGGNIAHHVAARAAKENYKKLKPIGVVSVQPFFGGEEDTESEKTIPFVSRKYTKLAWRAFLPEGASLDHEAANVFGPNSGSEEEWNGFPDTMVVIGDGDQLQDRQRQYCDGLRRVGVRVCQVEYANTVHAFFMFDKPRREQLIKEIGEFVRRTCEDQDVPAMDLEIA